MNRLAVTLLLADFAEVVSGKLYIMGGGWSVTGPGPARFGIAIKIGVPWDLANKQHSLELQLFDEDHEPVELPTPVGAQPVAVRGQFEAGRPAGLKAGTPLDVMLAFNVGPLPLPAGRRMEWVLTIDGETDDSWRLPFQTRPAES